MTPNDVSFLVVVEIADADDLPGQRHAGGHHSAALETRALHQPNGDVAVLGVAPHKIIKTVAVKVEDAVSDDGTCATIWLAGGTIVPSGDGVVAHPSSVKPSLSLSIPSPQISEGAGAVDPPGWVGPTYVQLAPVHFHQILSRP